MLEPWSRSMRGPTSTWLLQDSIASCGDACRLESLHATILLISLCTVIVLMGCACAFFREDKEEQIKPLCPQLVVRDMDLEFMMPLSNQVDVFPVTSLTGKTVCKVVVDWPDPFRPGASGVAATVRVVNLLDHTLTTLVARNALSGQSLILCRETGEMYASVEPDGLARFHVRHRTNVHLLTLSGDFSSGNVDGFNPAGAKVCSFKAVGEQCRGWVLPHVDAGLAICSLMATRVHRRLSGPRTPTKASPHPSRSPQRALEESGVRIQRPPRSPRTTPHIESEPVPELGTRQDSTVAHEQAPQVLHVEDVLKMDSCEANEPEK